MGIELGKDNKLIEQEIQKIKSQYCKNKKNVFFQRGIIDEITKFENTGKKSLEFIQWIKQERLNIRQMMGSKFGLKLTIRENMPQCNIVYDITKTDDELLKEMNSGCRERVRKAIKHNVQFRVAKPEEYMEFYNKWKELSAHKGFNIITKKQYKRLIEYILANKCWDLFVSEIEWEILAGSVCIYDDHRLIYLYGFGNSANKRFRNMGWHHFLKFKIFSYAREKWMTYVDMMWGSPTGFPEHPLAGVTKFKESLGGIKIEQYGSYDIVLNKFRYRVFKLYSRWKKH